MKARDEIFRDLRILCLDRQAVALMREDIETIREDEKKNGLPAMQQEALAEERLRLEACLAVTAGRVDRMERLLDLLTPPEREVLEDMVISPHPDAALTLSEKLNCEVSSIYRTRASAIRKLAHLRYGAVE